MVYRIGCKDEGEYMEEPVDGTGDFVYYYDYMKLHRLLVRARDSLETSVPLRGDTTQEPLIAEIEAALEEG